eukprot:gnl/MRDRNA2_/MRDRNA2_88592_c0_seq1.p1 gnl/MRDRNA2_/MRDRNA2_88592_c0~~gnl/MRDRNA2_/MRDRNA2_88592_c0_seq1.p1  ORF type:complete len:187 (+),score=52.90 gnl/MRDRNA2_/MRDRNA2_88592_c0_seq1:71-631(+)
MDSSSQVVVLRKDVQELEQMNGSLLDRVAQLERELALAQSRASDAEVKLEVVSAERDILRSKLAQPERKETEEGDLRSALIEIERFDALLRAESEERAQLETQLAWRQKQDIENGLSHSLEVSELERMNAMLAAENASLQEKMKKMQDTGSQPPLIQYKSEFSVEPCAEPEQEETSTARNDSYTPL